MLNIFVLIAFTIVAVYGQDQHACIFGQLICATDASAVADANIKMFDFDWVLPDTHMGKAAPDKNGLFGLCASASDLVGTIDPYVQIYHTCNAKPGCTRVFERQVPQKNVVSKAGGRIMSAMGIIDLSQEGSHRHECQPTE